MTQPNQAQQMGMDRQVIDELAGSCANFAGWLQGRRDHAVWVGDSYTDAFGELRPKEEISHALRALLGSPEGFVPASIASAKKNFEDFERHLRDSVDNTNRTDEQLAGEIGKIGGQR